MSKTIRATFTLIGSSKPLQQTALYSMPTASIAQRYPFSIVSFPASTSQISQIRLWNPTILLYYYRNFASANGNPLEPWGGEGSGQSDITFFRSKGWLLKDSQGSEIAPSSIPTERYIDIGNSYYRSWLASYLDWIMDHGYNGVMSDNLPAPTYPASWTVPVRGINPRTTQPYTDVDWFNDGLALATTTKSLGIPIVGNGIPQGDGAYGYFSNKTRCDTIIAQTDGVLIEGPVGWSHSDLMSRTSTQWKQNVDFAKAVISSGKICLWSNTGTSDMENDADSRYSYISHMMIGPSSKYFLKFRGQTFMNGNAYWTSLVSRDLGASLGVMTLEGSEYVRRFTGATLRLNPTTHTSSIT